MPLHFPAPFTHRHPPVQNINDLLEEHLTPGQRIADLVASSAGSWPFIIGQSVLLVLWGWRMSRPGCSTGIRIRSS